MELQLVFLRFYYFLGCRYRIRGFIGNWYTVQLNILVHGPWNFYRLCDICLLIFFSTLNRINLQTFTSEEKLASETCNLSVKTFSNKNIGCRCQTVIYSVRNVADIMQIVSQDTHLYEYIFFITYPSLSDTLRKCGTF